MITVKKALKRFLESRQAEGRSTQTVDYYRRHVKPFARDIKGIAIDEISADYIRTYIVVLQSRKKRAGRVKKEIDGKLSPQTVRSHVIAIRVFINWCWNEYDLPPTANPMRKIKMPSGGTIEPKAVSRDIQLRLIAATDSSVRGKRDRAILYFLAVTGCRSGGVRGLTVADLDLEHQRASVTEKGDKYRMVPLNDDCIAALRDWLEVRPVNADLIFYSLHRGVVGEQLSGPGLNYIFKALAKKAGITEKVGPHRFRHSFGKALALRGVNLKIIGDLMGHTQIGTTARFYTRFTFNEVADFGRRFNPLSDENEDEKGR